MGLLLALDVRCPTDPSGMASFLEQLLCHLRPGGTLLAAFLRRSDRTPAQVARLFSCVAGMRVQAQVSLSDQDWEVVLVRREAAGIDIPVLGWGWDAPLGAIMFEGMNRAPNQLDWIRRLETNENAGLHEAYERLERAREVIHGHFDFKCTGWSTIEVEDGRICLIAGCVHVASADGTLIRHVGGVGESWAGAAFLMLCEGIERAADAVRPHPELAGVAFGFSREGAMARALLECIERFHFSKLFVSDQAPPSLDIADHRQLYSKVEKLESALGEVKFYLISNSESFFIVLALSRHRGANGTTAYQHGLGTGFDPAAAAFKALCEVLQMHEYAKAGPDEVATRPEVITPQGKRMQQFWQSLDKEVFWERMKQGTRLPLEIKASSPPAVQADDDKAYLDRISRWLDAVGIKSETEVIFQSRSAEEGWVVRAVCDDFPFDFPEQEMLMRNPENVPFSLVLSKS